MSGPMHAACGPPGRRLGCVCGMERYELAAILKDVGNFSMDDFEGRATLQRTVCLLQAFGVNLGYCFTWYLRGPYCRALFWDGHEARGVIDSLPGAHVSFEGRAQGRYGQFKEFMRDKKHDLVRLEACASISYLAAAGLGRDDILEVAEDKMPELGRGQCASMWDELEGYGVVGDGAA